MQSRPRTYEQLLAELEHTQQALSRAEGERDDLRAMFNQSPVLIAANEGSEHVYTLANHLYRSVFGGREMVGKKLLDAVPEFEDQALLDSFREVYRTGVPYLANEVQAIIRKSDGELEEGFYNYILQPIRDAQGEVKDVLTVGVEVTEQVLARRRVEVLAEALKRADRLKDQFLGILSHELRTPINAIMGFASILEDEVLGPVLVSQQPYLGKILSSSEALLALVDDMLDMSRVQAGMFTLESRTADFFEIAQAALERVEPLVSRRGQLLIDRVPDGMPTLTGDRQRLEQVLINLLTNANKYTPEGGTITISARIQGDALRCEVADSGIGIAPEEQDRIFQPFTQVDMSNTRRVGGAGLGLAITKGLIEAHGGTIGVDSELGQGATFWFTLPLSR